MALSKYTVRCIKNLSADEIQRRLSEVIRDSYTDDEEANLLLVSANAQAWGF